MPYTRVPGHAHPARRWRPLARLAVSVGALVALAGTPAWADATIFLGSTTTPSGRLTKGLAVGANLILLGFEFEYGRATEDETVQAPSLTTGMGNIYAQTPIGAIQFYALAGAGVYREQLNEQQATNLATALGGGAKVSLAGPLKLRLDYRLFTLRGSPMHPRVHRVYMGLNLLF